MSFCRCYNRQLPRGKFGVMLYHCLVIVPLLNVSSLCNVVPVTLWKERDKIAWVMAWLAESYTCLYMVRVKV